MLLKELLEYDSEVLTAVSQTVHVWTSVGGKVGKKGGMKGEWKWHFPFT